MEAFEPKWIEPQRPPPSEGAFRLQKFDAATTVVESIGLRGVSTEAMADDGQ